MRKGISPVIATVIIVAVAIAISIAVAGWLMGLWGGFGQTEALKLLPDSYINSTNVVLHLKNEGGSTAEVYKIEISSKPVDLASCKVGSKNGDSWDKRVEPGQELILYCNVPNGLTVSAGTSYQVAIYTAAGNVYSGTVYGR